MELPQYEGYYGQKSTPEWKTGSGTIPTISTPQARIPRAGNTRRDFLNRKYEDDLENAKTWRRFTLVASAAGVAVIFLGAAGAIVVGLVAGALAGGLVGGISTLAGLITNIFLHLVYNPAEKANEQLERTCAMIVEEERREEDWLFLDKLDKEEQKKLIIQHLSSRISSSESIPHEVVNRQVRKPPQSQKKP